MARIRPLNRNVGLDARRPIAENDDAIGEKQRLFRVVGH